MTRLLTACLMWLALINVLPSGGRGAVIVDARPRGATQLARTGQEFKIKVGRRVTFERDSLRIKFVAVLNDSRCPKDVTCVWAGNAEVLLEVSTGVGRGKRSLKLNTNGNGQNSQEGKYQRFRVKLLELSPYPQSGRKIEAGEYTATLSVSKE
jgi:hypothetical protein